MIHSFETSNPGDLPHDLVMATVHTDSLRGRGDCTFVLPQGAGAETPLVILLHGVHGSHWSWPLLGRAGATLSQLVAEGQVQPMILAMPSDGLAGYGSAYMDEPDRNVSQWITRDVPEIASELAPSLGDTWFIGGLSMGGWGAIRLALTAGSRFAAVSAHSAITNIDDLNLAAVGSHGLELSALDNADKDLSTFVVERRDRMPHLRFDCGTDDRLLGGNRDLHRCLDSHGIPHEYSEHPGGHDWNYWQQRLPHSLRFFQAVAEQPSRSTDQGGQFARKTIK